MAPGLDLLEFASRFADAQAVLLDAHVAGVTAVAERYSIGLWLTPPNSLPLVLSGGLHAGNVIHGIHTLRPWAVDVSSGVESSRGVKDAAADPPLLRCGARSRCHGSHALPT